MTLPGVKIVFELGLTKSPVLDPETGVKSLDLRKCTQGEVEQRAGRCGRTTYGLCVGFYGENDW